MAFKWLSRLTAGLTKTRSKLADGVRSLFRIGRKVDAEFLRELEETLILGDVGVATTRKIVEDLKTRYRDREIAAGDDLLGVIKNDLKADLKDSGGGPVTNPDGPTVVMIVGVNGSGKTTAVARLARLMVGEGKTALLAACDTFRAAADEQLAIWAGRVGVDIVRHRVGADPGAVAFDAARAALARKVDYLLVDTAGRLHTQDHLMRELGKIRKVLAKQIPGAPHEVLLVLDATTGQNAIVQAREFRAATDVTGIFLAKLDGTAKGGIVLAIKQELGIPVRFVGIGEKADDVTPFDADAFVDALFGEAEK
ncbi:MAG: signal recognition particle-docking protein FtsY [Planctomycetota bacterium]|nr:signal recognition particle-docking protein FtsY [Planctomycetota bacterium]